MAETQVDALLRRARSLRLEELKIEASELSLGYYAGPHRALRKGAGVEFAGHRPYTPGDDLRRLDHHARAKFDQLLTREFQTDTERACHFIVDTSASMYFRGQSAGKLERAALLTAALILVARRQGDPVGLSFTHRERAMTHLPGAGAHREAYLLRELAQLLAEQESPTLAKDREQRAGRAQDTQTSAPSQELFLHLAEKLPLGALTFYLSDCLDEIEHLVQSLKPLNLRGRKLCIIQVLSPEELDFPFTEAAYFSDPEGGASVLSDPSLVKNEYLAALAQHQKELQATLAAQGIGYHFHRSDDSAKVLVHRLLRGQL